MKCYKCEQSCRKFGKDRYGHQRWQCLQCYITFSDVPEKPLGEMRLPIHKAIQCIRVLMEGCSVRSVERLTGVHRDTICNLIVTAGERAKEVMESKIVDVKVQNVEVDEIWGFVGFESNTKLIHSWHLGKRTPEDTECFLEKLRETVADGFQLTSDGFKPYLQSVHRVFGKTANYAQLIKQYGLSDDERRYSPPAIISIDKKIMIGDPDKDRICTSYIERNNLTIRTYVRRMTRLTCAFSKKWENHEAAVCLFFAYFNFCRKHSTLKTTPVVAAGLAVKPWTIEELLTPC